MRAVPSPRRATSTPATAPADSNYVRAPHTARGTFVTVVVPDVRRVSHAAVAYDSCSAAAGAAKPCAGTEPYSRVDEVRA